MDGEDPPVTLLLRAWRDGDSAALDNLIPMVYAELKRMAAGCLRAEPTSPTLQPTALVHEAYLRLAGVSAPDFQDRTHFRCATARIMRQILVDRARARHTGKRDGGSRVELDDSTGFTSERASTLISLDDALAELERQDKHKARILELKYFAGLTAEEISGVLGLTLNQVNWQIRTAQAWLRRELSFEDTRR